MTARAHVLDPSTFVLRELTAAEKVACWRTNSESWAGRLSVEQYVERETVNGSGLLTGHGGIRYWGFVGPASSGVEGEEEIYAAVESLKKTVAVKTSEGFGIETTYALASVFTPAKWRGRKIAAWMMRRLGEWFDGGALRCHFSVLYSDVGEYYSPFGWITFPSLETALPAVNVASSSLDTIALTLDALSSLCERDAASLTNSIETAPLSPGKHVRLAVLPTYAQACWHFSAEDYAASKLFNEPSRAPAIKGAMSTSGETCAYWIHDYNEDKLSILRLISWLPASTPEQITIATAELALVLRAAQAEAASWALKKVVLWNPDELTLKACELVLGNRTDVIVRQRTESSVPALRWNAKIARPGWEKRVEWVALEKYTWC